MHHEVDISPKPDDPATSGGSPKKHKKLELFYDMTTGAISGDLVGTKGATITATGNDTARRATIRFRVE